MDSRAAILKTLLYSEIFNYPLKKEEIYNFLISKNKLSRQEFYKNFKKIKPTLGQKKSYFYISIDPNNIKQREIKERIFFKKNKKAKEIIKKISIIPTIKFIGISGALSMKNSKENDDIDIFIISERGFTWTTRFLVVIFLNILGVYRKKDSINFADKICVNMIIDGNSIYFKNNKQNLYIAHEIVQIIPVFNKSKAFENFINANSWINKFLPNVKINNNYFINKIRNSILDTLIIITFKILFIEQVLKFLQFLYMKKHITKEIVLDNYLGFHPFDYETYVLKEYRNKLRAFGLLD